MRASLAQSNQPEAIAIRADSLESFSQVQRQQSTFASGEPRIGVNSIWHVSLPARQSAYCSMLITDRHAHMPCQSTNHSRQCRNAPLQSPTAQATSLSDRIGSLENHHLPSAKSGAGQSFKLNAEDIGRDSSATKCIVDTHIDHDDIGSATTNTPHPAMSYGTIPT